jgi:hypothetical protein
MSDLRALRHRRIKFRDTFPQMPADHAAALGHVVASWSIVEDYCRLIIQCLIDTENEPGHAVTAEMPFIQRISVIGALTHCFRDHDLLDHWEDIVRISEWLRSRRNDVVHAGWQLSGDQNILTRIKARGRVSIQWKVVPTESLLALEKEIMAGGRYSLVQYSACSPGFQERIYSSPSQSSIRSYSISASACASSSSRIQKGSPSG